MQLGEAVEGEKPKRAGLPEGTEPASVDLELALKLLSLPREVGRHPEDGEPIIAGIGRFGPYVQHGKTYANLESGDEVFNIGLNRAVTLIAEKIAKGPRAGPLRRRPRPRARRPSRQGGPVVVKNGRYGPYVTHDGVNATLPSDMTPETITLEEAVALLDARAERTGGKTASRRQGRQDGRRRQDRRQKGCQTRCRGAPRRQSRRSPPPRRARPRPTAPPSARCRRTGKAEEAGAHRAGQGREVTCRSQVGRQGRAGTGAQRAKAGK